ncbi:unnamed protein product [Dracunculus medinensis]|uniref:Uncharacterized protein n=1 Tax=Dracunculus medinensis TaxID=318479 RepID=A0A3P7SRY7_DRAME|nr:unnamed protein product [Dracunculus medinensis]
MSSLSGVFTIPLLKKRGRNRYMNIFIALAISTLSADTILHIIPLMMRVHRHSHGYFYGGEIHSNSCNHLQLHSSKSNKLATLAAESGTANEHAHNHSEHHEKSHSDHHGHRNSEYQDRSNSVHQSHNHFNKSDRSCLGNHAHIYSESHRRSSSRHGHSHFTYHSVTIQEIICKNSKRNATLSLEDKPVIFCGLKTVAITILLGDALHNFIDGIAVGASFAMSFTLGVSTSLAVIFHELPHEVGDFIVLIESGLSIPKAITLNFLSALTAFAGLFIGLAAIAIDNAVEILLAVTAAIFLYIAWIEMLIHLKRTICDDPWYLTLILQSIGFLSGFILMFLVAWYEHYFH